MPLLGASRAKISANVRRSGKIRRRYQPSKNGGVRCCDVNWQCPFGTDAAPCAEEADSNQSIGGELLGDSVSDDVGSGLSLPGSTSGILVIDGCETDAHRRWLVEHVYCAEVDLSQLVLGRFTDEEIHGEEDTGTEKAMVSNDMYVSMRAVSYVRAWVVCDNKRRFYHRASESRINKDSTEDQNFIATRIPCRLRQIFPSQDLVT